MKFNVIIQTILLLTFFASGMANARQIQITPNNLPSSPIANSQTNNELLSCKTDMIENKQMGLVQSKLQKVDTLPAISLSYLNDAVKRTYETMRKGVIKHVTMKVAMSVFNFNVDGFAAKNIVSFVSDATHSFLPFEFANGVKITKATAKGVTIIYRVEMPIPKKHHLAISLALAGKISATSTVCNDVDMVNNLLGRDVVIQYDYYDSNGAFFSSFTING